MNDPSSPAAQPTRPPAAIDNSNFRRFETRAANGSLAFLDYTIEGDRIILEHTFVPDILRGKGVAANLARAALTEARQRHWKVVPHWSYVAGFSKQHPEFADLVEAEPAP
jgi:predicted GNAT family acetyltransferase